MHRIALVSVLAVSALGLSACEKAFEAPNDRGVCYHMGFLPDGGYKFNVSGIAMDAGVLTYLYPGSGNSNLNTTEAYLGGTLGMYGLKYSHTVSSRYFGEGGGRGTGYLAVTANPDMGGGLVLNTAFGYTMKKSTDANTPNYGDWKLGATYDLGGGLSASAAVIGATKKDVYAANKTRVVLTITKSM